MVSVIIPCYNAQTFIPKNIASLIGQTFAECEFIYINDGSKDNSRQVIIDFMNSDPRIKLIDQMNSGVSAARNAGIALAQGEYILFIDADDYIETNMIEQLVNMITKSNADMAMCGYVREDINGNIISEYSPSISEAYLTGETIREYYVLDLIGLKNEEALGDVQVAGSLWICLFKKDVIMQNRLLFNTKLYRGEDVLFKIEYMLCIKSLICSEKKLYHYVMHNASCVNKYQEKFLSNQQQYLQILQSILKKYLPNEPIGKRIAFCKSALLADCIINVALAKDRSLLEKYLICKKILNLAEFSDIFSYLSVNKFSGLIKIKMQWIKDKNIIGLLIYSYWKLRQYPTLNKVNLKLRDRGGNKWNLRL